jgi:hypothetical protein
MQFLTGGESFENLCPVEQWNLCNLYWKPGRDYLLMSLYLKLRGIGFEGEAKNYLGLNPFRIIESVDALIRLDITGRFNRLAQYLVTVDPFDFEDAIFAHSIQVQSMVAWGRFYYRLPGLLKDLNKSKQWLERSILESLTNPTNLPIDNDPILSRLFLVDTLKAEGEKKNHEKIRNLLQEVEDLENIGFSPWEVYLGDILQGLIRNFRKEFPITKSDP